MKTICINLYKIDEHPDKSKVFSWINDNWHDLNDHTRDEFIASLEALHTEIGGTLDYSISTVPDRGEYIRFTDYDKEALMKLKSEDCPLTCICWDIEVIEAMQKNSPELILEALHKDTEYVYSDEGLEELCNGNEW